MNAILILLSASVAFIAGLFYGEKETIIRQRWQNFETKTWADKRWFPIRLKDWWETNNWQYRNKYVDYLMRYPLAMFKDGYHFTGTMSVVLLLVAMAIVHSLDGWWVYVMIPVNLFWHGIGVNAAYHDWIKEL